MKKLFVLCILLAGCVPAWPQTDLSQQVQELNQANRKQAVLIGKLVSSMKGTADPNLIAELEAQGKTLAEVQDTTDSLSQRDILEVWGKNFIEAAQKSNAEKPTKYSGYIEIVLTILTVGLGIYIKFKRAEVKSAWDEYDSTDAKYKAMKNALRMLTETMAQSPSEEVRGLIKKTNDLIGEQRSKLGVE